MARARPIDQNESRPGTRTDWEAQARDLILRDLVDALIHEDLFAIRGRGRILDRTPEAHWIPRFELEPGEVYFRLPVAAQETSDEPQAILFRACPQAFLQPFRLARLPVVLVCARGARRMWRTLDPVDLMTIAAAPAPPGEIPGLPEFLRSLEIAVTHTALSLAAAGAVEDAVAARQPTSLLAFERLASLRDRPFHPSARAKMGWGGEEYRRFGPEYGRAFGLDWLAVRRDCLWSSPTAARAEPASLVLRPVERERLQRALLDRGLDEKAYLALPAHPWHGQRVAQDFWGKEANRGVCVPLVRDLGRFIATSSARSLAPEDGRPVHLKLSLAITSLGALRTLPPRFLHNGARATALLAGACSLDRAVGGRLALCQEDQWWAFKGAGAEFRSDPGYLSCLARVYPAALGDDPSVEVVPMGALAVSTTSLRVPALGLNGDANGANRGGESGILALFAALCDLVAAVALSLFRFGLMPELHGQNVLLVVRRGEPQGLLLRDHDTVRIYPPWLAASGLPDPGYELDRSTPNTIIQQTPEQLLGYFQTLGLQVNLYAIAGTWARAFHIEEAAFWAVLRDSLENALARLDLPPGAGELAARVLFAAETWPTKLLITPLLRARGASAGMPSATGQTSNPLRAAGRERRWRP